MRADHDEDEEQRLAVDAARCAAKRTSSTPHRAWTSCWSSSSRPRGASSAVWVAPLRALSCRRGRASATASLPSAAMAMSTARAGPAASVHGGQQLGHVGVEQGVVDRELGEAEVDAARLPSCRRRRRWPAAGRGGRCGGRAGRRPAARRPAGRPRTDVAVGHRVERRAVDAVVRQHHRVDPDLDDAAQAWRPHADVTGDQRHQRLVLHRPAERGERPVVADVLEAQEAVGAEHEVGRPLGLPEDLDEQLAAVGQRGEVRRRGTRHRRSPGARRPPGSPLADQRGADGAERSVADRAARRRAARRSRPRRPWGGPRARWRGGGRRPRSG